METRKLGYTELKLTRIGLGTWAHGGGNWKFSWGPQDDQSSIKAIHKGLDSGVNWIDTAPVYGLGHAETVTGKAIKGMAHKPYIATKCSRVWDDKGNITSNLSKDNIKKECEASLKRIQIDTIDLYQIHWPQPEEKLPEAWGAINELIQEGKIRYGGVSNFNMDQIRRIEPLHPVASLQPPYSMLKRDIEKGLLQFCRNEGIGVVVYSPLQKGLLTGKMTPERIKELPPDDHRKLDVFFQEPLLERILEKVSQLTRFALEREKTMAQLAIAWVLRRPEVTSAIVGARTPEQISEILPGASWGLSQDEVLYIDNILEN